MLLCNFTLQPPTSINTIIHGNFSGGKHQEIVVSRGKVLDILKPDPSTGKVHTLLSVDVFAFVRSLLALRLTGSNRDYIFVGSDSGRILILEYNGTKNTLEKVHQETFGKTGCRRIVPGQYLAADPKGRAVMISAVEKQKLVYILNRDAQARLTISSPLEAHKSNCITFCTVGVDVAFENPMFACLEMDYEDADNDPTGQSVMDCRQLLTFYELDLGLNHVVRKYSEPLSVFANIMISVPGGNDGPSGVLLCSENYITYKNLGDQPDIRCPIPRRRNDLDDADRPGILIVCSATHKTRTMFFFLIQSEQGDIFKVTLNTDDDMVTEIKIKYFDTVPVASSMCVLRSGFLFVASEFGNHFLYQITKLGDEDDDPEFSSAMPLGEGDTFFFNPGQLRNLLPVDEMDSLSPIMNAHCADLFNEDSPQIFAFCGRGPRSSLRILRHGLEVSEMAVSDLPGSPNAVWTVKKRIDDEYDSYIVVSFVNATLVLSIGETVEEVTDSGFLGTTPTLWCDQIGEDALIQVYPEGIRHIRSDKRVNEWRAPSRRMINRCAINKRQIVLALAAGELVYFEMDQSGQLNEYTERREMQSDVVCMALPAVPEGEIRSRFLAVGLADHTVRIVSLDPNDCLNPLSMQAIPAPAESLCIVGQPLSGISAGGLMYLNIGLQNGVLLRIALDNITGDMSDTRTRYLGLKPIKLFRIFIQGQESILAVSSRTWLSYNYQSRFFLTPLSYEPLEFASGFASEQCPEGIVAISMNTLRILSLEKLGVVFNQEVFQLKYTPRKFVVNPDPKPLIYLLESDYLSYTEYSKQHRRQHMAAQMIEAAKPEEKSLAQEMANALITEKLSEEQFGPPKAAQGMWASMLRIMDLSTNQTLNTYEFEQNEAATSIATVEFALRPESQHLIVGVVNSLILNPRTHLGGYLYCFKIKSHGSTVELEHKTQIDEVPGAIASFHGKLLVGVGNVVRLYDIGKKKLLRKCETRGIPTQVSNIYSLGGRVIVSDLQESVHFLKYKRAENQLVIFSDDTNPRHVTALVPLDYSTVAVSDKFGTISVLRLGSDVNDNVDVDPTGIKGLWDRGLLNGASYKTEVINNFYVGETVTSLQKIALNPGSSECIVYTTLSGTIGVLVPFTSNEDHYLMQHLEMHMRVEYQTLCGRDHAAFRSYYFPIKGVIDGDLCEKFTTLEPEKQKYITSTFDRTPAEVAKKLEDMRTRYAF
ncbi:hypothetical protein GJ496_000285 [Pomphorhynchus laevis]|nr:hypothetical protein GJ496_000285 [Pomphorhynchus laevis]